MEEDRKAAWDGGLTPYRSRRNKHGPQRSKPLQWMTVTLLYVLPRAPLLVVVALRLGDSTFSHSHMGDGEPVEKNFALQCQSVNRT